MRIIAGELKGRRIQAPPGRATRPMLERVREAMFSTLAPWLDGARVLDLFAGSGSLSFEALSRGAARSRLVERDPATVALLEKNVRELGLEMRAQIRRADALERRSWGEPQACDIVFLDPPYPMLDGVEERANLLEALGRIVDEILDQEGVLVLHAPRGKLDARAFGQTFEVRERRYGSNAIWYVQGGACS